MKKRLLAWPVHHPALCVLACLLLVTTVSHGAPAEREQAVIAAREGRYDEAIAALRKLASAGDMSAALDLVVVLGWAGRHGEAIAAFEALPATAAAPAWLQRAAAASYRAERRFVPAEALARALLKADPEDAEAARLLSGVLVDAGRASEAVALMRAEVERRPKDAEHWIALGNAAAALPDPFQALRAFGQAQRLAPQHRGAAQASAGILQGLGAPYGAALQLQEAPLALRVDQAGRQVRWATQIDPPSPARRFEFIDAALAGVESLLAEVAATPGADPALQLRLRLDRLVALRHRERWADTVAAAGGLRADGHALPAFARQAEADALLALRRPAEALVAYNEVLAADPDNRSARVGRFFSEVEVEDFAAAFATIDAMAAAERPFRRTGIDTQDQPNSDWLDATILAGNARSYADMQAEAWARLKPLADGAPALSYLRSSLAAVAAGRGWPRLADEEIHIAASLSPNDRGIQVALADSAMRRQRWPEAGERIGALKAAFPEDAAVQRAARDLDVHGMSELEFGVVLRDESDDAPGAPGTGIDVHLRVFSPPFGEQRQWRAAGAFERATAEPVEGQAIRIRSGAGLQYRGPDVQATALAWANTGTLNRGGASLNAAWQPDDHWWLGADAELFAQDTPLRALLYGIHADAVGVSASYNWHESRGVSAGFRYSDFSDGNRRQALTLGWLERMVTTPRFRLDLRPSFYTSSNSLDGAPYFNPSRDRATSVAFHADHLVWREYERSFGQQLQVAAGNYWQSGYGSKATGSLLYQHTWRWQPLTEWRYGAQFARNAYDGVGENTLLLFLNLNHRF
jgi:biofilm PGA synthesis protein PgaA